MRIELQGVEAGIRNADDDLNAAAERDAMEYAVASDLAEVEAPHFARTQKRVAGLMVKSWSLNRAIIEIDFAWRVKRTAELDAEITDVGGKIPDLEEKARKAQDALDQARWHHTDLINERRDTHVTKRHFGEYARFAQGPQLRGWLNFMTRSR